jgi:hypothetical protein
LTNVRNLRLNGLKFGDISFITSLTRLEVLDLLVTHYILFIGLNNIFVHVSEFLVLVPILFFVVNICLNVQTMLVLIPLVHFSLKNADVANVCTRGNYEVASEDAE